MKQIDLEEYDGFIGEPEEYKNPINYNLKLIQNKLNEIIDWINDHKDQLL